MFFFFFFFFFLLQRGKIVFFDENRAKKNFLFSISAQKRLGRGVKSGLVGVQQKTKVLWTALYWPYRFKCLLEVSVRYLCYDVTDYQNHVMTSLIIKI